MAFSNIKLLYSLSLLFYMVKEIIIYSTKTCPYCTKVKEWMKKHNIYYTELDITDNEEAADKMISESKQMGVPVIKISEKGAIKRIIVGYDIEALEKEFK
jgi:glutaredoxin 3